MPECVGKSGFSTREQAVQYVETIPVKRSRMKAYLCTLCGLWHVGHKRGASA